MSTAHTIPSRSEIPSQDQWDLSKLCTDDAAWEQSFKEFTDLIPQAEAFSGSLDSSAQNLHDCLEFLKGAGLLSERIGYFAFLRYAEDAGDSTNQSRYGRVMQAESQFAAATSFIEPEIQAIDDELMEEFLSDPVLEEYRIMLKKILRYKPYILSAEEEKIIAMERESAATAQKAFSALTDVDLEFGTIEVDGSERPVSQASYSSFMINPDREVREAAFRTFYKGFEVHKNTLATLYAGSVQHDTFIARIRNHQSSRSAALFPDNIKPEVYDNLISTIHDNLPALHAYYGMRKRLLGLEELRHYDVYVPLVSSITSHHTFEEAIELVIKALAPLGHDYTETLHSGLRGGWVDKYENKGKRSGAFSAGSYIGDPYILMNFKEDVLRDVFTLAHEAGHSMHSYYSVKGNPFQHYNYSIFEAEVASTFNEQLLAHYLLQHTDDRKMRAYIIGKQIDDVIATIYRQTMFAEFEHLAHEAYENGTPLTLDYFRTTYRELLEQYFGPEMVFEDESDLEGLRIPHFYRAFYVYKYATGLSAAIALSQKVLSGGKKELEAYLRFLRSGGSEYPLDSLKRAGVDMSTPKPVEDALAYFSSLLEEFESLLSEEE